MCCEWCCCCVQANMCAQPGTNLFHGAENLILAGCWQLLHGIPEHRERGMGCQASVNPGPVHQLGGTSTSTCPENFFPPAAPTLGTRARWPASHCRWRPCNAWPRRPCTPGLHAGGAHNTKEHREARGPCISRCFVRSKHSQRQCKTIRPHAAARRPLTQGHVLVNG